MHFFFSGGFGKKIITNLYFIFFFMFICQNVGNLKGFLLVYLHGLDLITLSSYSSTSRGTSYSDFIIFLQFFYCFSDTFQQKIK